MLTLALEATVTPCTLRDERIRFFSGAVSTISVLLSQPKFSAIAMNVFVLWSSSPKPSTTTRAPSRSRSDSADFNAPRFILVGNFVAQSRGCGPCTLPPPFQSGERRLAMRARPVPFWRQSLRPAPETSPRVLVADVPARLLARKLRTASWTNGSLIGTPKTVSDSSISPTSLLVRSRTLVVGITESLRFKKTNSCSSDYFLLCRAAFLTTTTLPFAPGTAPLIINRLLSASTRATVSRFTVTRTSPIWPDERLPLITRDGKADAPIDPGARTFIEPWDSGPRLKLWRLTVPANPRPFDLPTTSTTSPSAN